MSKSSSNWVIERINEYLNVNNWTIYRLAKESELPYSSLNNIFVRNTMPTISTLEKICNGLQVSMSDFFNTNTPNSAQAVKLTSEEAELIEIYRSLSTSDTKLLNAYLLGLAKLSR